jgi:hypothetical protein
MSDPRFRRYLVTCGWMEDLFRPFYGDAVARWYGAIDLERWPDTRGEDKDVDVLVYDKIRWERDRYVPELLEPALRWLDSRGLTWEVLRYGRHRQEEYRGCCAPLALHALPVRARDAGHGLPGALASNVPVLAWDNGLWLDPAPPGVVAARRAGHSVPYFSEECGRAFRGPAELEGRRRRRLLLPASTASAPRRFVQRELSHQGSARLYLEQYRALLPRASPRPLPRSLPLPSRPSLEREGAGRAGCGWARWPSTA